MLLALSLAWFLFLSVFLVLVLVIVRVVGLALVLVLGFWCLFLSCFFCPCIFAVPFSRVFGDLSSLPCVFPPVSFPSLSIDSTAVAVILLAVLWVCCGLTANYFGVGLLAFVCWVVVVLVCWRSCWC